MQRILHTSDWLLGKALFGAGRLAEQERALKWMLGLCREREADCVVVAGGVYGSVEPDAQAQRACFEFFAEAAQAGIRVVLIPGEEDPAPLLRAPARLLARCGIHVAGEAAEDQAIVIRDAGGAPQLGIAAVCEAGAEALAARYAGVKDRLEAALSGSEAPRIALGRRKALEACGAAAAQAPLSVMGGGWDYAALGGRLEAAEAGERARFSGSPVPAGFCEAEALPEVTLVTLGRHGEKPVLESVPVPVREPLISIGGDLDGLEAAIERTGRESPGALLQATYTGVTEQPDLAERLEALALACGVRLLDVRYPAAFQKAQRLLEEGRGEGLQDAGTVFSQLLAESRENEAVLKQLQETFSEAMALPGDEAQEQGGRA